MAGVIGSRFVQICIDDSANRIPDACRVIVEGPLIDPASLAPEQVALLKEPNQLIEIRDPDDADTWFGKGSVLSEGLKVALDCCRSSTTEVYALPRENMGTATIYEATFTVGDGADPAAGMTKRGRMDIYWGEDRYSTSITVYEGMTAAEVAAAVADAVPAEFLFTAEASDGVLTLTAKNGGEFGNDLFVDWNWHGRDSTWPEGLNVTLEQTVQGVGPYQKFEDYRDILGDACCACCLIHLSNDPLWQDGALEYVEATWECDQPNCMTMGYTYASGNVEEILAHGNNYSHSAILAHCNQDFADAAEGDPIFPWMKTAAYGAKSCCIANTNPEVSIEGLDQGVLDCVSGPSSCYSCFDFNDKQELEDEGFVTAAPTVGGDGFMASPYIEADISNGRRDASGYENRTWMDMNSSRLARQTARLLFEQLRQFQGLALFSRNTAVASGVKGTSPKIIQGKLRAWFKDNIGVLFSEPYDLDEQIQVSQESDNMPQCYGDPRRLIIRLAYQPPLRIKDIRVTLRPEFDPLCASR